MTIQRVPKVVILMATYNGENYIEDQLMSLQNQNFKDFRVIIRDDGSLDRSVEICEAFASLDITIVPNSGRLGPCRNFLELLRFAEGYEIFMFADQDDIWHEDKVAHAYAALQDHLEPCLYYTEATQWWDDGRRADTSFGPPEMPLNIFENYAMGCTVAINSSARELILKASKASRNIIMHDWFSLILISIVGRVIYEPSSSLEYRIHSGQNIGPRKKFTIPNFRHVHNSLLQFDDINKFIYEELQNNPINISLGRKVRSTRVRNLYVKLVLKFYSILKKPIICEFYKFTKSESRISIEK